MSVTLSRAASIEQSLRAKLGVDEPCPFKRLGWIVTLVLAALAAVLRFVGLNHPHQLVFDETYYVKGGYSLITYGYERDWIGEGANLLFTQGSDAAAATKADYVVHPPLGKWLIGLGQLIFGTDTGLGWRFSTAIGGVIAVILVTRIALRLFHSITLAALAGLFMAIDGVALVMSRTAILDNHLMLFVLAGFWAILKDRDWSRARLAHLVAHGQWRDDGTPKDPWGPRLWWRPWLVVAGIFIGLGCGVKWSAAYALAVFGITVWLWDMFARKIVGVRLWFGAGVFRGGIPAFVNFIPVSLLAYASTWLSWFASDKGYKRGWAATERAAGNDVPFDFLGDTLAEWIAYHRQMMEFHTGLSSPHTYQSQPWDWIIQRRPVSFYWPPEEKLVQDCGAERCVQAITSNGNPLIWWLAVAALLLVIVFAIRRRDWRAWAILAGYGAMYLPWFQYLDRTIYQFYSVAFVPFVVLALTYGLAAVSGTLVQPRDSEPFELVEMGVDENSETNGGHEPYTSGEDYFAELIAEEKPQRLAFADDEWSVRPADTSAFAFLVTIAVITTAASAFWFPIWTGMTVSYDFWHLHMWLPSWS